MRRQNSNWQTGFVSEAGNYLENHDDFAFVELDDLACWVLVDGIDSSEDEHSAKLVVEHILQLFTENPSISKGKMVAYLKEAHALLLERSNRDRLKASVVIVVTDYVRVRWASAGNTRLYIFQNKQLLTKSTDQSYYQHMIEKQQVPADDSAGFEERNNLTNYLGMPDAFKPFVSDKFKMIEGNSLVLATVGFWEQVNGVEMLDVTESATEPAEAVNVLEDLLLSKQAEPLENYTIVSIFATKLFQEVNNTWKIIKRIILIMIPIMIALSIFFFFRYRAHVKKEEQITLMNTYENNGDELALEENYERSLKEYEKAITKADEAKQKKAKTRIESKKKSTQLIVDGDQLVEEEKFDQAVTYYQKGKKEVKKYEFKQEETVVGHIDDRITETEDKNIVHQLIHLGDLQTEGGDYVSALDSYNKAKTKSVLIKYDDFQEEIETKVATTEALMKKQANEAAKSQAETLEKQGDENLSVGKTDLAIQNYRSAVVAYENAQLPDKAASVGQKIVDAEAKKTEEAQAGKKTQGEAFEKQGDEALAASKFDEAIQKYQEALAVYDEAGLPEKVTGAQKKIEDAEKKKQEAFVAGKKAEGEAYEAQGDTYKAAENYPAAKDSYTVAERLYQEAELLDRVFQVERKLIDLETLMNPE